MTMKKKRWSATEVSKRGHRLYELELRKQCETEENIGKIILLDVETGHFEIGADGLQANLLLKARFPDTDPYNLFAIRIGYDAVYAIGSSITRVLAK